jgi:catechol 2,3-dioxygenase-like lactoylglutathione lyase family enzyme
MFRESPRQGTVLMRIDLHRLDHLVLPCGDVEAMAYFYVPILDMEKVTFGDGWLALYVGG